MQRFGMQWRVALGLVGGLGLGGAAALGAGCDSDDEAPAGTVDVPDVGGEDAADTGREDAADAGGEDAGGGQDVGPDAGPGEAPFMATRQPLPSPADPLEGAEVTSCATYLDERCEGGSRLVCDVFDAVGGSWVDAPDTLTRRAFLFDRWRDLYNSPNGMAIDRDFTEPIEPGTPESEWGDPAKFDGYWGTGDGGIWTGWSVVAAIVRYSQTGTEADYQRMEEQVADLVQMYEVTGIPGYLVRYHYLRMPPGGPKSVDHIQRWEGEYTPNHHHRLGVDPATLPDAPEDYVLGVVDPETGERVKGTLMWQGRPSIDQNTGPMTALPMAFDLLRDEDLKDRIVVNLTCYLKRLERVEVINLQENPDLLEALLAYFNSGDLQIDEGDIDLTAIDKLVGYVHRQVNVNNEDTYPTGCPDAIQMTPTQVIDAASDDFLTQFLDLFADMDTNDDRPTQIDHFYYPSLRGGDAMHLMHLATMAWHMTGDEAYVTWLEDELVANIDAVGVLHTAGALDLPKYCKKYYGEQITFGPWWAFLQLLDPESVLFGEAARAFKVEMWDKLVAQADNLDMALFMAAEVPDAVLPDKAAVVEDVLSDLEWMGGNGGLFVGEPFDKSWLDEPRRSHRVTRQEVLDALDEWEALTGEGGWEPQCPTEQEEFFCSAPVELLGLSLPNFNAWSTHACSGDPLECPVGDEADGQCVWAQMNKPLPLPLRRYTDYLWQRNPFAIGHGDRSAGSRQYAGSDYSVPYWVARRYGLLTEGQGQVLAWREDGTCE